MWVMAARRDSRVVWPTVLQSMKIVYFQLEFDGTLTGFFGLKDLIFDFLNVTIVFIAKSSMTTYFLFSNPSPMQQPHSAFGGCYRIQLLCGCRDLSGHRLAGYLSISGSVCWNAEYAEDRSLRPTCIAYYAHALRFRSLGHSIVARIPYAG